MFNRILVAVADDEVAGQVIATARQLASALAARIGLVHVVDIAAAIAPAAPMGAGVGPLATPELLAVQEDASRSFLDRTVATLGQTEVLRREGSPAPEIVAAAREWAADLLVVGTHGRGGLGRLVLGSVAEAVLRDAPCPVLAVRLGVGA